MTQELTIEKLLKGGQGLARLNGEVILLPGALPAETIEAEILGKAEGVRRGRIISVITPSPLRREPDCPLAGRCGGCDFLHVTPGAALSLKTGASLGRLADSFGLKPELIQSPRQERYRNRATLHLGLDDAGRPRLGFFDAGRAILEISECRLLSPQLEALLPPLREWAARHLQFIPGPGGEIEVSLMKDALGPQTAVIFCPPPPAPWRREASLKKRGGALKPGPAETQGEAPARRLKKASPGALSGPFMAALSDLPAVFEGHKLKDTLVLARTERAAAPRRVSSGGLGLLTAAFWPQWDLALKVKPGGFTQVNPEVNLLMVSSILKEAEGLSPGPKTALDLYAGLGNISIPLAKTGFQVTAVEQAAEGIDAARINALGLGNLTLIRGRSEKEAAALASRGRQFKLAVLDPPRSGARDMAPCLAALGAELIIYVACHPAALERDIPAFISLGYGLAKLKAFDMFPRTSHLEALAVLRRN